MSFRRAVGLVGLLGVLFLLVVCSGDSRPTEPRTGPIQLALATPSALRAVVADTVDVVAVASREGQPVTGVKVDASVQDGGGTILRASVSTGADGRASFRWVLGTATGTQSIVLHGVGVADTAALRVTAEAAHGPPATLDVEAAPADTAVVATEWPVEVRVVDAYDNPVAGLDVRFDPSAGSVAVPVHSTDENGSAGTAWSLGTMAGAQVLTVAADTLQASLSVDARPGPLAQVRIDSDSLFFDAVGAESTVSATGEDVYGNEVVVTPTIELLNEARWSQRVPVIDAAAVNSGVVRSLGAGTATLQASAGDGVTASIRVRVAPRRPQVHAVDWPKPAAAGDEVVLHGFRVDEVEIDVDGAAMPTASADSAVLRVVLPGAGAGCQGAASTALTVTGADVHTDLDLIWRREGEIDLSVGQSTRLSSTQADCFQFARHPGAEYILAFLDDDRIVAAADAPEPTGMIERIPPPDTLTFADRTVVAAARGMPDAGDSPGPHSYDLVRVPARPDRSPTILGMVEPDFRTKTGPWAIGDRAMLSVMRYASVTDTLLSNPVWGEEPGTVIDILGNGVVVFLPDADSAALDRAPWRQQIEDYRALFASTIEPLLDAAYGPIELGSSGNQQVVAVVGETVRTLTASSEQSIWIQVRLLGPLRNPTGALELPLRDFDRQAAHAWQLDYTIAACTACEGTRWSHTGGAMVIETMADAARRGHEPGVPANLNQYYRHVDIFGWSQKNADPSLATWVYSLPYGYSNSQLVLEDFLWRLLSAGTPFEESIRAVLQGALTGWYGRSLHQPGNGLVDRMRARLGPAWNPTDGVLKAVASVGADDRTHAAEFQQPWSASSWQWSHAPWRSTGELTAGRSAATLVRPFGINFFGYFHVLDDRGASLATTTTRAVEWLVLRTR